MMKGVGLEIYFSNLSFLEGVTLNKLSQKAQKRLIIFAFTIVPLVLLLMFSYYPLVKMVQYSLTDWNGSRQAQTLLALQIKKKFFLIQIILVFSRRVYIIFYQVFRNLDWLYFLRQSCLSKLSLLIFGKEFSFFLTC